MGRKKASKLSVVDVNVQRFYGRKQSDMPEGRAKKIVPTVAFLARIQLSNQRAAAEDFEFLKSVTGKDLCPEYGGINMTQVRERGKQPEKKTTVLYTQFLDMTPAEPDTMKTAMVHAQHITTLTDQEWAVFTCDQQLYKVVVNIFWHEPVLFPKQCSEQYDLSLLLLKCVPVFCSVRRV